MRPLRLELRNFMSYRDAKIDLREIDMASIVGPNGAGKSTILQAITYALWGQVRTTSHNDVVMRGSDFCAVRLWFSIADREFSIIRRRKLSGKGSSDLELSEFVADSAHIPLTKSTIRDTQAEIDSLLGMSYEAFSSSALLQQGEASKFSDARPGERKELLAETLGLGWFQILERLARAELRQIDTDLSSTKSLLEDRQRERDSIFVTGGEIASAIKESAERKGELETSLDLKKRGLAFDRECLDRVKALTAELNGKIALETSYEQRKDDILAEIDLLETKRDILGRLSEDADNITASKDRMDQLRGELTHWSEVAIEASGLRTQALGLEDDENSLSKLEAKHDILTAQIEKFEEALTELAEKVDAASVTLEKRRDETTVATRDVLTATAAKNGIVERNELLSGPDAVCPTCRSELQDKNGILLGIEQEFRVISADIVVFEAVEQTAFANTELARRKHSDLLTEMETVEYNTQSKTSDLRVLNAEIDTTKMRVERKKEAQRQLDELDFDQEKYNELKLAVADDAKEVDGKYADLIAAQKEVAEIAISLVEKQDRLDKGIKLLDDLQKEIDDLENRIGKEPDRAKLESQIANTEISMVALQDNLQEAGREIVRLEGIGQRLETVAGDIVAFESKIGLLEEGRRIADLLVKASSKSGAQALLIEAAIPQLEKDANEFLGVMAVNMKVALNSQRQTLKGTATETLDIVVYSGGHVAPIETLSGGERFRADLALRLAIGRMLARRSSAAIEMLAIDEGFGSQDSDGQEAVVEVISSLQAMFGLILVISHVQAVAEAIGTVGSMIVVGKVGNESKLEVI